MKRKRTILISVAILLLAIAIVLPIIANKKNADYHNACQEKAQEVFLCLNNYKALANKENKNIMTQSLDEFVNLYRKSPRYDDNKFYVLNLSLTRIKYRDQNDFVLSEIDGWIDAFEILSKDYDDLKGYVRLFIVT